MSDLRVESSRGDVVESWHRVSVAVVDRHGRRVAWSGDSAFPTFLRSAAKPFQALPVVADGAAERYDITPEELALLCASHNGTRRHVEIVGGLLARIGLDETALACGPHRPLLFDLAVRGRGAPEPRDEVPRTPIASNCSGKHTGMLALARHHDWPLTGYHRAGHPVQERCKTELAAWTDVPAAAIAEAIDGCGVVCFRLPLDRMALAYARLGTSDAPAARAVVHAMTGRPELVGGADRLDSTVMAKYPEQILAKVGAEGVYGAALLDRGLGVALKVEDGHARAAMAALVAVLDELGMEPSPLDVLRRFSSFPVSNTRSERVGALRAAGRLTFE